MVLILGAAATGFAQVDGVSTFAETACDGADVVLTVTLNVYDTILADIIGWVVKRETLGSCMPDEEICDLQPMPTVLGEHTFILQDTPLVHGKAIYYILGVDSGGTRHVILWPRRTMFAQADCLSDVAARGTVVVWGGDQYYLEVCPDECWWGLSYFDPIFPEGQPLPPEGMVVEIHGEIFAGMEGPYIIATSWEEYPLGCQGVATVERSWGTLKSLYR